jgi:drug/metabolite transporter (DMT)-like permease
MEPAAWLWIPITLFAAFAQTLRNVAQRGLVGELGTLGATLVRFLYGLPFAALWIFAVQHFGDFAMPHPGESFFLWVTLGAVGQITGTALLLRVMTERNFTLGVAYSKSEIIQVAVFGYVFLADQVTAATALAIAVGTFGVLLLSPADPKHPIRGLLTGWTSKTALLGLASGTGFAFAAVGFRGSSLALESTPFPMAAATTLLAAQIIQTLLLGGWIVLTQAEVVVRTLRAWRPSLVAGFAGATASAGWFTAMAIEPVANVRTLALVELLFAWLISNRLFRETLNPRELTGLAMLLLGLIIVSLAQ